MHLAEGIVPSEQNFGHAPSMEWHTILAGDLQWLNLSSALGLAENHNPVLSWLF